MSASVATASTATAIWAASGFSGCIARKRTMASRPTMASSTSPKLRHTSALKTSSLCSSARAAPSCSTARSGRTWLSKSKTSVGASANSSISATGTPAAMNRVRPHSTFPANASRRRSPTPMGSMHWISMSIILVSRNLAKPGTLSRKKSVRPDASRHESTMASSATTSIGQRSTSRRRMSETMKSAMRMAPK